MLFRSAMTGLGIKQIGFSGTGAHAVYILQDSGELRRVNLDNGHAPALTTGSAQNLPLAGRSALLVGLGHTLSAMEFARP